MDSSHGIFVERRLRELEGRTDVRSAVVAPVPWFPFRGAMFGRYGQFARVTKTQRRHGIDIYHPRYPLLPKIGMSSAPALMARASIPEVGRVMQSHGPIDLLDAHYFYPDGVAAAKIVRHYRLPLLITARGSDVNLLAKYEQPRRAMVRAAETACAVVAVSQGLATAMLDMGIPERKIHVLRNGVDLEFFCPGNRDVARRKLDVRGRFLVSVGMLKPEKGHDLAIRLIAELADAELAIIGAGSHETQLRHLVSELGLEDRVRFTGKLDADALRDYYQAADALVLMSVREGMPNVVLESMACGTPVVATRVGGIPEVVEHGTTGQLVAERSLAALQAAWEALMGNTVDRAAIRRHAEKFSWDDTIDALYALMRRCAA